MSRGRSTSHEREARETSIEKGRENGEEKGRRGESPEGGHRRTQILGSIDSRVTSTSKVKERIASGEQEVSVV